MSQNLKNFQICDNLIHSFIKQSLIWNSYSNAPSFSTASTPISEAPDPTHFSNREADDQHEARRSSSPSTGSADSNPASDVESETISSKNKQ